MTEGYAARTLQPARQDHMSNNMSSVGRPDPKALCAPVLNGATLVAEPVRAHYRVAHDVLSAQHTRCTYCNYPTVRVPAGCYRIRDEVAWVCRRANGTFDSTCHATHVTRCPWLHDLHMSLAP